jgi:hypothetical protein
MKTKELITKRLNRAYKNLEVANSLLAHEFYGDSVSKSYYAIFFAANALLLTKNLDPKKHSGVISFFNRYFVKTGEVEKELAEILKFAQKERISADYDEFYSASVEEAKLQLENAEKFLQRAKEILQEKGFL